MSIDADDLFERAEHALDRDIPTVEEVTALLALALDALERDFPNGRPGRDATALARLEYMNLLSRVRSCRWQLENGQCVEYPRGRRSQLEPSEREEWDAFLASHPELGGDHRLQEPRLREPLVFTDAEVLAALGVALEQKEHPWSVGATSSAGVLCVLMSGRTAAERHPFVSRAGKQLARLAREGRVVRLRQKWTQGRGCSVWSLEGLTIGEWWLKQYEVADA